jgi:hypothetical protein
MDYDQRLHAQNDKRNEEKTMSVDEKVFFREATLRICSNHSPLIILRNQMAATTSNTTVMMAQATTS